jgi:hypothetical protein
MEGRRCISFLPSLFRFPKAFGMAMTKEHKRPAFLKMLLILKLLLYPWKMQTAIFLPGLLSFPPAKNKNLPAIEEHNKDPLHSLQ